MLKDLSVKMLFDELVGRDLFTWDELKLLTDINGYSMATLNEAIYTRYGFIDYQEMTEELEK